MTRPIFALALLALAAAPRQSAPDVPTLFAPGVISTGGYESHPAFTADGRTVYFVKSTPSFSFWTICESHLVRGRWTAPVVAPFSGRYADADPFITRDGAHFYFISTRPESGSGDAKDLDIWVMDRAGTGWSAPRRLPAPINSPASEWFPTLAANGTIYFGSERPGGQGRSDLYRSRLVDGKYAEAENLGAVLNTAANEFEPFIAPDEKYLIFMSGRPGGKGAADLWVSYNRAGTWSAPANLGAAINSPAMEYSPGLSPDGTLFYWTSARETFDTGGRTLTYRELNDRLGSAGNGLGDIYYISVSALHLEPATPATSSNPRSSFPIDELVRTIAPSFRPWSNPIQVR
jgi:Tol biopolymer transport system component